MVIHFTLTIDTVFRKNKNQNYFLRIRKTNF